MDKQRKRDDEKGSEYASRVGGGGGGDTNNANMEILRKHPIETIREYEGLGNQLLHNNEMSLPVATGGPIANWSYSVLYSCRPTWL